MACASEVEELARLREGEGQKLPISWFYKPLSSVVPHSLLRHSLQLIRIVFTLIQSLLFSQLKLIVPHLFHRLSEKGSPGHDGSPLSFIVCPHRNCGLPLLLTCRGTIHSGRYMETSSKTQ